MFNKLKSRRWWVVVWAIVYVSGMSIYLVESDYSGSWPAGIMALVGGIVVSWMTVTSIKKTGDKGEK